MVVRKVFRPVEGEEDGAALMAQLDRLLAANRKLLEEFERHKEAE